MPDPKDPIQRLHNQYVAEHEGEQPSSRELYLYAIDEDEDLAEEIWAEDPTVSISDSQWEAYEAGESVNREDEADEKGEGAAINVDSPYLGGLLGGREIDAD